MLIFFVLSIRNYILDGLSIMPRGLPTSASMLCITSPLLKRYAVTIFSIKIFRDVIYLVILIRRFDVAGGIKTRKIQSSGYGNIEQG
jgi:hypothetical protein